MVTATLPQVTVVHPPVSGLRKAETFVVTSGHSLGPERKAHCALEYLAPELGDPVETEHGSKLAEQAFVLKRSSLFENPNNGGHLLDHRPVVHSSRCFEIGARSCEADQVGCSSADEPATASTIRKFGAGRPGAHVGRA